MRQRRFLGLGVLALVVAVVAGCSAAGPGAGNPDLAPRGTAMTTAKPTRQDLSNKVSLAGKVTMTPIFGLVAPIAGEVRYFDVAPPRGTPTKPTRVATIWAGGKPTHVEVPAGSTFAGRLVDDRSTVTAGMPIVSAKLAGYGIVADIDGAQAYRIADAVTTVQAQIKNGPGPFACTVLGTIAALPAGTVPEQPKTEPSNAPKEPGGKPQPPGGPPPGAGGEPERSDPTGMRLTCTAPADVKLINGANATLEVVTEKAANVLVVPVEAVAGSQGKGKVEVVGPDGRREIKDVELGLTDGKVVEIKSGLTGDETLSVPGPNLPPAKTEPGPGDGTSTPSGP